MSKLNIFSTASTVNVESVCLDTQLEQTNVSPIPSSVSFAIPPAIDKGQAIYWSYKWKTGEEETRKSLAEGRGHTFPNAQEAIR